MTYQRKKRKRYYRLLLTGSQIDTITTACGEWASQEDELGTLEGRRISKALDRATKSIWRQVKIIDDRRNMKL